VHAHARMCMCGGGGGERDSCWYYSLHHTVDTVYKQNMRAIDKNAIRPSHYQSDALGIFI